MDAVSDILRFVRLDGAVYLSAEFTAPWCWLSESDLNFCSAVLPGTERVVSFHLITGGSCWAWLTDDPASAFEVHAGELLVVPQGEAHIIGSAVDLPAIPATPLVADQFRKSPGELVKLAAGGGGAATRIACGFLSCDKTQSNPLLAALPRIFKIDMRGHARLAWIESSLEFALSEAAEWRAGSATILAKLSELLFVESVRRCIDTLPADRKGWLAGMGDRFVGRALSMLHAQPAHDWTVDELARKVGASRSVLAQRFAELLGQPPMQYLARWRLQIASQELLKPGASMAAIAEQVGYESEAAFSRAFKREFGTPPARWRRNGGRAEEPGQALAPAVA